MRRVRAQASTQRFVVAVRPLPFAAFTRAFRARVRHVKLMMTRDQILRAVAKVGFPEHLVDRLIATRPAGTPDTAYWWQEGATAMMTDERWGQFLAAHPRSGAK